ncbi:MAG: hypothetical protein Q4P30_00915 [Eubacteriales bacterium]|nr:hypothetical protein [Eubacteriales bacterium]
MEKNREDYNPNIDGKSAIEEGGKDSVMGVTPPRSEGMSKGGDVLQQQDNLQQSMPQQQGYLQQGVPYQTYPQQDMPQQQGYPQQGIPQQQGYPQQGVPYQAYPQAPYPGEPNKKRGKKKAIIISLVSVLVIAAIAVTLFFVLRNGNYNNPEKVVDDFCETLNRGEYHEALKFWRLTEGERESIEVVMNAVEEQLNKNIDKFPEMANYKEMLHFTYEVNGPPEGDKAKFKIYIEAEGIEGSQEEFPLPVIVTKEQDGWKLDPKMLTQMDFWDLLSDYPLEGYDEIDYEPNLSH